MSDNYANTIVLRRLSEALQELLEGRVCLTEGVRKIASWRFSNHGLREDLFETFTGVDSETDTFPVGPQRGLWNAPALKQADVEREAAEALYRDMVMKDAKALHEAALAALPGSRFNQTMS